MPKDAQGKETGWISKHALQEGALAADEIGRKAMADGYILPRMLSWDIRVRLFELAQLEKRLKALEEAKAELAPAPAEEAPSEEQPAPAAAEEKTEEPAPDISQEKPAEESE